MLIGTKHKVQLRLMGMFVKIHKTKNVTLVVVLKKKITKDMTINPLEDMNMYFFMTVQSGPKRQADRAIS